MIIYRVEWSAKMALGWICFWVFKALPASVDIRNRAVMWVLQWAGFYACSEGFAHWMTFKDENTRRAKA